MKKVLIMASGFGSNFESIIKYFKNRTDIDFRLLVNKSDAFVLKRAKKLNIKTYIVLNSELNSFFENKKFNLVVMAGFDKILDEKIVKENNVINIHPSLLPKYKGLNAIKRAYIAHEPTSGITIHYADKEVDSGEIIYQKELLINPKWSLKRLEKEIHKFEHFYYPRVIEKLLGLNVLIVGGGARENCIVEKVLESKYLSKLYLYEPNDGFRESAEELTASNFEELAKKAKEKNINLAIIGSENYLAAGIVDVLNKNSIKTIGPNKKLSKLESSKLYAKKMMQKYKIKTSPYKKIENIKDIDKFLSYFKTPLIKADGLAGGKGVYLNSDKNKIKKELEKFLNGKFDEASKVCLIEEKLTGFEMSLFSFWDGETFLHFPICKDFKQNAQGLNTGGLASICPFENSYKDNLKLDEYKQKLKIFFKKEKISLPFVLYSGLMMTNEGVYVLEFNVRLGDPETQSLMNYVQNDWLDIFHSTANKMLDNITLKYAFKTMYCVVLAASGYPLKTRKGLEIKNLQVNEKVKIYYSNILKKDDKLFANGGRLLSLVSDDKDEIYKTLDNIDYEDKMYKTDI